MRFISLTLDDEENTVINVAIDKIVAYYKYAGATTIDLIGQSISVRETVENINIVFRDIE